MRIANYCPNCGAPLDGQIHPLPLFEGQAAPRCINCGMVFGVIVDEWPEVAPVSTEPGGLDSWQGVEIETPGPDSRDTDALESLLALCRLLGLNYQVRLSDSDKDIAIGNISNWPYRAVVSYSNWPVDFYAPITRARRHGRLDKTPAGALRFAISDAISNLKRNAEIFSWLYQKDWQAAYGKPWSAKTQPGLRFTATPHNDWLKGKGDKHEG